MKDFIELEFEPVGKGFEQYNFIRHQGDLGYQDLEGEESSDSEEEKEEEKEETPEYLKYLATLDPKNWKDQDHYKVLGLEKLRYKATQSQIKKARNHLFLFIFASLNEWFIWIQDPTHHSEYKIHLNQDLDPFFQQKKIYYVINNKKKLRQEKSTQTPSGQEESEQWQREGLFYLHHESIRNLVRSH
mgnify:CR=1 FL=1